MNEKTDRQSRQKRSGRPRRPDTPRSTSGKMVIRRNAEPQPATPRNAAATRRNAAPRREAAGASRKLGERMRTMGASHVAVGLGAGTLGNLLSVLTVGKGWVGPKTTASIMLGTGVATTAAGAAFQADHVLAAGAGLTAAGAFSLANQFAVDAYMAAEKSERDKRLAEARAEAGTPAQQPQAGQPARNVRRLVIVDRDGSVLEDDGTSAAYDEYDEYAAA